MCRFMLHTAGVLLAYAYKQPQTWEGMLDDLILGLYQRSGAPIRELIQECVNQVLNEAEQSATVDIVAQVTGIKLSAADAKKSVTSAAKQLAKEA